MNNFETIDNIQIITTKTNEEIRAKNLEDFMQNIPQSINAKYKVTTKPNDADLRKLPVSLFYGFSLLLNNIELSISSY